MKYPRFFPEAYQPAEVLQVLGAASAEKLPSCFSLAVWNMYKGRSVGWQDDFRRVTENREIVVLQESVINTRHDPVFCDNATVEWVMARSHRSLRTLAATGIKTGCVAPSKGRNFFLSPDVEPIVKTPKMLLATTYDMECGKKLLVLNIHAINFVSLEKYRRQIMQIVEAVDVHDGPMILAGDFNTWNAVRYRALIETTRAIGLEEAMLTRKGRMLHLNRNLDHIFYRGMTLCSAGVMTDVRASDHYPLFAEFSLSDA